MDEKRTIDINMDSKTRQKLAQNFRSKSDDSFLGAQELLSHGRYRDSCSRAWYSIYQAVAAGAYLKLKQAPPKEHESWKHNAVDNLLHHFLRASGVRLRYSFLVERLSSIRELRVLADYRPDEGKVGKENAEAALVAAEKIRRVVYEVLDGK